MSLAIRPYAPGDATTLARIFHRAVREGAAAAYSEVERAAWSPSVPDGPGWEARLAGLETRVAERDGAVVGFMSLEVARAYLDFTYVLPEEMGRGVADALYAETEASALRHGLSRLTTEASHLARPFFARHGWQVVAEQEVERRGVRLRNTRMVKDLTAEIQMTLPRPRAGAAIPVSGDGRGGGPGLGPGRGRTPGPGRTAR